MSVEVSTGGASAPASAALFSARAAGASFRISLAVVGRFAVSGAAVGGGTSGCALFGTTSASGSVATSAVSNAGASSTVRSARLTTRTPRFAVVSFLGKYLFRIFSANSFETELEGTLTSTPSRRTSSMSRLVSSFSSLARSYIRILEETVMHSFSDADKNAGVLLLKWYKEPSLL